MLKNVIFFCILSTFARCKFEGKHVTSPYDKSCQDFIKALYNKDTKEAIAKMDPLFISVAGNLNLDSVFNVVSDKIRKDYKNKISATFITSEPTINEGLPSTFLVYKIESSNEFGYYFFYINDKTNKILVFSDFSRIKPKR